MKRTREEVLEAVNSSMSRSDVLRKLGIAINGNGFRYLRKWEDEYDLDLSFPDPAKVIAEKNRKWKTVTKTCPICGNPFETKLGHPREKQTCGYACSNTYFRSGPDNGNWSEESEHYTSYRKTCFHYYEEACLVCGESEIVDVHHLDHDRSNNSPKNLIPLCPTHHMYIHRGKGHLIMEQIRSKLIT